MIFTTNTKLNIGLSITSKRPDGYHDIESVFYPLNFGDVLEVVPAAGNGKMKFAEYGIAIPGEQVDNLCVKAYHLLDRDYQLPSVNVALLKRIPIGAGLGGGSSDGVEMLKALNTIFSLNLSSSDLKTYALSLGSDCPFFVDNIPKFVAGRGEILEDSSLELTNYWVLLVFPEFHVSTVEAYASIQPKNATYNLREINKLPMKYWQENIVNDFERPIAAKFPIVSRIKKQLGEMGAVYTAMSGSGSTVYGIFKNKPHFSSLPFQYIVLQL